MNIEVGYLLERKMITYNNEELEIFKVVDYVAGISFVNTEKVPVSTVITTKEEIVATVGYNKDEHSQFIFIPQDLKSSFEEIGNQIDFQKLREKKLKAIVADYYLLNSNGQSFDKITGPANLLSYLNKLDKKEQSDFNEEELKNKTDISQMYSEIKKTIISQDEQIMQILTALFKNQKVIESDLSPDLIAKLKENILIYGSTGTGKTEILKRISKLYNIPIVIEDATSLSETGYVGRKITDMLEDLYLAANKNIHLAEKGILVIDEFDKLAEKQGDNQSHVSRLGVQRSLLKLLDGSLFYFDNLKFDTSKLTVVALGAFTGITEGDDYKHLTSDDFMRHGIMRELIGRFSKTIPMNPLNKEDIIKILKESDFSPLNTYQKLFDMLGVSFEYNDAFIEYLAELAVAKQSGARSIKTVFDDCISSALFRIFAGEYTHISLIKPTDSNSKPYILTKKLKK